MIEQTLAVDYMISTCTRSLEKTVVAGIAAHAGVRP